MNVAPQLEAIVLEGGRAVPDELRDQYFALMAQACRAYDHALTEYRVRKEVRFAIAKLQAGCPTCGQQ